MGIRLLGWLLLFFGISCSRPQVTISLAGFANDTVAVTYLAIEDYPEIQADNDPRIVWDTLVAIRGKLIFSPAGKLSYYRICPLETPTFSIEIIIEPANRLYFNIKRESMGFSYTAEGTAIVEDMADHDVFTREIKCLIDSTELLLGKCPEDEELARLYGNLHDKRIELSAEWLGTHTDSPAAILVLRKLQPEMRLKYYPLLSEEVRGNAAAVYMEVSKKRAEEYIAFQNAREMVKEGEKAPDFLLPDSTGRLVWLSQFQGKWVVLDFWGTWCGWCIKGIPDMKRYEAQYRRRCTFVSIDCNESRDAWLAGIEKYKMPWLQLYSNPKEKTESKVNVLYGIQGYPAKFIIRPDGRIHKIVTGEDPAFYRELDRLFR